MIRFMLYSVNLLTQQHPSGWHSIRREFEESYVWRFPVVAICLLSPTRLQRIFRCIPCVGRRSKRRQCDF